MLAFMHNYAKKNIFMHIIHLGCELTQINRQKHWVGRHLSTCLHSSKTEEGGYATSIVERRL